MLQTLLIWVMAAIIMLLYLPVHIIHYILKIFLVDDDQNNNNNHLNKRKRSNNIAAITSQKTTEQKEVILKKASLRHTAGGYVPDVVSRIDAVVTRRGNTYRFHTKIRKPTHVGAERKGEIKKCNRHSQHIVLIHGAYNDSSVWDDVATSLCHKGYYTYAVDLPGFGCSTYSSNILDMDVDDLADDLTDALSQYIVKLNINKIQLVGYSFGGFISSLLAVSGIGKKVIQRLILVAPAGLLPIGSRWSHLQAIVFRLKMVSLFMPGLHCQGENLIMKFIHTRATGSKWLKPMILDLIHAQKPFSIISGSMDELFNVEQAILVKELAGNLVNLKLLPAVDHYIQTSPILKRYLVKHITRYPTHYRISRRINTTKKNIHQTRDDVSSFFKTNSFISGVEMGTWKSTFLRLRRQLLDHAAGHVIQDETKKNTLKNKNTCTFIKGSPHNKLIKRKLKDGHLRIKARQRRLLIHHCHLKT